MSRAAEPNRSDPPFVELKPGCLKLRHKMMYLDVRQQQPGMVDDSSDTRVFWCLDTHEVLGQDGRPVSPGDCTAARECYCGADRHDPGPAT